MRPVLVGLLLLALSGCVQEAPAPGFPCPKGPPWLGSWTEPGLWRMLPADDPNASVAVVLGRPGGEAVLQVPDSLWGAGNWSLMRLGWGGTFLHEERPMRHSLSLGLGDDRAKITGWFDKPVGRDWLEDLVLELLQRVTWLSRSDAEAWRAEFVSEVMRYEGESRVSYLSATKSVDGPFRRDDFVRALAPYNGVADRPGGTRLEREGWYAEFGLATMTVHLRGQSLPRLVIDVDHRASMEVEQARPPSADEVREASRLLLEPLGLAPVRGFPTLFLPNLACAHAVGLVASV